MFIVQENSKCQKLENLIGYTFLQEFCFNLRNKSELSFCKNKIDKWISLNFVRK